MTKFWRTKTTVVLLSIAAVFGTWSALAWPDWKASGGEVTSADEYAAALQYLAAQAASEVAPARQLTEGEVRRVYVVTRHEPQQVVVVTTEGDVTASDVLAAQAAALAAIPTPPASPRPASPPPAGPTSPRAPAPSAPTSPVTAPSTSAPPPPKPAAPAPAPAKSKGS